MTPDQALETYKIHRYGIADKKLRYKTSVVWLSSHCGRPNHKLKVEVEDGKCPTHENWYPDSGYYVFFCPDPDCSWYRIEEPHNTIY